MQELLLCVGMDKSGENDSLWSNKARMSYPHFVIQMKPKIQGASVGVGKDNWCPTKGLWRQSSDDKADVCR